MSYIADKVTKNKTLNEQLVDRLCQFYQLVAQKDEGIYKWILNDFIILLNIYSFLIYVDEDFD